MIIMRFINKNKSIGLLNDAKKEAEKIIESANEKGENIKKNKIIQAKEKFLELKSEHEKIIFSREDKIKAIEREISSKESQVDSIIKKNQALNSDLEKRHLEVQDKINSLEKKTKEVEKVRKNQIKQLELISGLSEKEAKGCSQKKALPLQTRHCCPPRDQAPAEVHRPPHPQSSLPKGCQRDCSGFQGEK